jgi:hypothetical protein
MGCRPITHVCQRRAAPGVSLRTAALARATTTEKPARRNGGARRCTGAPRDRKCVAEISACCASHFDSLLSGPEPADTTNRLGRRRSWLRPGRSSRCVRQIPAQSGKASAPGSSRPLVVVSLGVRDGDRDQSPPNRIASLAPRSTVINERYGQRALPWPFRRSRQRTSPLRDLWLQFVRQPGTDTQTSHPSQPATGCKWQRSRDPASVPRLLDLLATVQGASHSDAAGPLPLTPTRRSAPRCSEEAPRLDPTTRPGDRHQFLGRSPWSK